MLNPAPIDKRAARRSFERAADSYDKAAILQREIADRMGERLAYIRIEPSTILDIGAGTGYALDGLMRRYTKANLIALDFALPMLARARRRGTWLRRPRCICGDAESLPIADQSVDMVYSNATLQWCNDLTTTFGEFQRVLRPGGLLLFSTFGPDTLRELRAAWASVDQHPHVSTFMDMHDIGDALVHAGLADPVMDAEHITLTYQTLVELLRDLKDLGVVNASADRSRGLIGRQRHAALAEAYESYRCDGRLPASWEVVYGHAWAPVQRHNAKGETIIPVASIGRRGGFG